MKTLLLFLLLTAAGFAQAWYNVSPFGKNSYGLFQNDTALNVGIKKTIPTSALDVRGKITSDTVYASSRLSVAGGVGIGATAITTAFSTGDIGLDGSIRMVSPSTSTTGNIFKGSTIFMHNYGTENLFLGEQAGNFTLTNTRNTAIGYHTFQNISSGANNTAVGAYSSTANTTGSSNTSMGMQSLSGNLVGSQNTAIGMYALLNTKTSNNTSVGYSAGATFDSTNVTGGASYGITQSTYIGSGVKGGSGYSVNETAIGYLATGAGSNSVTLGNTSVTKTVLQGNVNISSAKYLYLAGGTGIAGSWRMGATLSGNMLIEYTADGTNWTAKATYTTP